MQKFSTGNSAIYYTLYNVQYLYKDQYSKLVFEVPPRNMLIDDIKKRVEKYESVNPIYQKNDESNYIIKFNDSKHNYKSRLFYDVIFYIHKNFNEKTQKTYINLHIQDMKQRDKKDLPKVSLEAL